MFVFLPRWYKQHPSLRSLFVSELPVFFPFIQDHYSSNLITNAARVTNMQHDALSYAFRLILRGQENIMARMCLRLLLIIYLSDNTTQHNTNVTTLYQEPLLYALLLSVDIRLRLQFGYKREAAPHKA